MLAAARRLFAAEGYDRTGTEQIAAEARVTRGALHDHFPDKAELFRAVMEEVAGEIAQQLIGDRLDEAPGSPLGGIQAGISAFLEVWAGGEFHRIVLSDGPRVLGSGAWDQLVERHGRGILEEWLSWAVTAGDIEPVPARSLARLLIAMLAEASVAIALADDPAAVRAEMVTTVSRLISGLRGPGLRDQGGPELRDQGGGSG